MAGDAGIFADSMMELYGARAEHMAREHAARSSQSGDAENQAFWLNVAEIIRERHKDRHA
jgi:hypothetical protein